jgi:hypothetical protein
MSRLKPLLTGLGFAFIILLSIITLIAIFNPALLLSLETQSSNNAYHLTGGLLGTPIQTPPVTFRVGEIIQENNGSLAIDWAPQQTIKGGVFQYYGSCEVPVQLYGLNITNKANVPIVKIVIRLPGFVTPAPLPRPWVTNETQYSPYLKGNVTSIEIANVNIPPHTTYILWNASSIGKGVPIYFIFENGSVYETSNYWEPNYPT